ncbi:YeeE/YedE thiosulfate transporter family protein, partial [Staphylococcus capitis]|uniref:YeeE/YedE thiosulfate transporter family protein n=1 Tax=Staphylococcus capitis TaxID=29388 RepID=UPI0030C0F83C
GIVLAGGCATGTWYRAGEGLIGSWVALILYAVTSAITKTGVLLPLMNVINRPTHVNASVSHSTGIPNWVLVLILTVITITLV